MEVTYTCSAGRRRQTAVTSAATSNTTAAGARSIVPYSPSATSQFRVVMLAPQSDVPDIVAQLDPRTYSSNVIAFEDQLNAALFPDEHGAATVVSVSQILSTTGERRIQVDIKVTRFDETPLTRQLQSQFSSAIRVNIPSTIQIGNSVLWRAAVIERSPQPDNWPSDAVIGTLLRTADLGAQLYCVNDTDGGSCARHWGAGTLGILQQSFAASSGRRQQVATPVVATLAAKNASISADVCAVLRQLGACSSPAATYELGHVDNASAAIAACATPAPTTTAPLPSSTAAALVVTDNSSITSAAAIHTASSSTLAAVLVWRLVAMR